MKTASGKYFMSTQLHYRLRRSLLEKKGVGSRERKVLEAGRTTEDEMQARGRGERERASKGQREHGHSAAQACPALQTLHQCLDVSACPIRALLCRTHLCVASVLPGMRTQGKERYCLAFR